MADKKARRGKGLAMSKGKGVQKENYEKGRGPTGIAFAIQKGHPDAENPKTRKKYPERQTPEYKANWNKKNKTSMTNPPVRSEGAMKRLATDEAERKRLSAKKSMEKRVPRRMYDKPAYERDPNHYKEESCCEECKYEDVIEDVMIIENGEKKGVKLNNIIRTSENPNKKFKVYVRDPATKKIKVVRFGDPNMEIKRDDPNRRKNFRARHNCDNPGPKTKARYWSCKQWRGGAKVEN